MTDLLERMKYEVKNMPLIAARDIFIDAIAEIERLRASTVINIGPCRTTHSACDCVIKSLEKYREALQLYANEANWEWQKKIGEDGEYLPLMFDKGQRAREALK